MDQQSSGNALRPAPSPAVAVETPLPAAALAELSPAAQAWADQMTRRKLHVKNKLIGADGVCAVAEALTVNTVLQKLILWDSVGADGACALGEARKVNKALQSLDLWDNSVGTKGARALAEALKVNTDGTADAGPVGQLRGRWRCARAGGGAEGKHGATDAGPAIQLGGRRRCRRAGGGAEG